MYVPIYLMPKLPDFTLKYHGFAFNLPPENYIDIQPSCSLDPRELLHQIRTQSTTESTQNILSQ